MSVRTVVVVHRLAMVAEGIAAALDRLPGIASVGVATTADEGLRLGERADAVAIDQYVAGGKPAAERLRRKGVRVVFLGEPDEEDEGIRVSPHARVASLARALVPEFLDAAPGPLTGRERQVLALVAQGLVAKQVARHLGISHKTVELHKSRILTKLRVPNQAAAVHMALGRDRGGSGRWISVNS